MIKKKEFAGVFTAIITPFKNNCVDYTGFTKLVQWQIEQGVDGIVVCGSTGEAHLLTEEEYEKLVNVCCKICNGKVKVIVGVPSNCTKKVISIIQSLKRYNADAFLVCTPYYVKPTQQGIFLHFNEILKNTKQKIVVYDIPGRCATSIDNATMTEIMQLEGIVAVKDTTEKIERATELELANDSVAILSGNDISYCAFRACGGDGGICVTTNFLPKQFLKMEKQIDGGDLRRSKQMHFLFYPVIKALFLQPNPVLTKYATNLVQKYINPETRMPLTPAPENEKKIFKDCLERFYLDYANLSF